MTKPTKPDEPTEATQPAITKAQIKAARDVRLQEFNARLSALCNELECDLYAVPQLADGRIVAVLEARTRF